MRGGGAVPPKTTNAVELYLLLLAMFILISILNEHFVSQTISETNSEYWNQWWGHCAPCTINRVTWHPRLLVFSIQYWPAAYGFCTRSEFLFIPARKIRPNSSFINLRHINGVWKWGPEPLLKVTLESPKWYCWILRVRFSISHWSYPSLYIALFSSYSLRQVQNLYLATPLAFKTWRRASLGRTS